MAKTIKEMAHDHRILVANSDDYYAPEDSFEAGANAVLEVIEQFINDTSYKDLKQTLRGVIKELKGE